MSHEKLKNFINGQYIASHSRDTFEIISPVNEELIAISPRSDQQDVDSAYQAAAEASQIWKETTPSERQKALLNLADVIEKNAEKLAELQSVNTGQIKSLIIAEEIQVGADQLRFFAGAARLLEGRATTEYVKGFTSSIRREPLGIVGQVCPWNYPFLMAIWKIAPALAAGNTIVLKPSDTTPSSTLFLAELAAPFFPKGTFNVVLGAAATGAMITSHPKASLVSITGSIRAGIEVAKAAAENLTRPHLELGGKAPVLVFEDCDMDKAVSTITTAGFFNAGQDCTAPTRVIVQASIFDAFLDKFKAAVKEIHCGAPDDDNALYGALNNQNQLKRIESIISNLPAHAKIETGGKRVDKKGFYFEPTVVSGLKQSDDAIQKEIFGPIITLQTFTDEADAIDKANDVEYGLASSVWTSNHGRATRLSKTLDFGAVWINTHIVLTAEMPHGGFKHSGYGKDLSAYSFEEYTRIKHVMSSHE